MSIDAQKIYLGTLASVTAGFPLRTAADALPAGDVSFVQMRDVVDGASVDWAGVPRVELPGKRPVSGLGDGDILFAARGTNNYALALRNAPARAVCSPHFFVLRVSDKSRINPCFLAWQINQKPAQDYFRQSATGSHIPNIRRSVLEGLEVAVPSVSKQRMIADLWNAALEEKRQLNALLTNRQQQLDSVAADLLTARMR